MRGEKNGAKSTDTWEVLVRWAKNRIVILASPSYEYEVRFDECQTAGACLDWVHQVSQKVWAKDVMADFLEIFFAHINKRLYEGQ